ncbi:YhgE/Pip domain-containing protein [Clostridium sp. C105KSO13]|uniref:YhgE/Pip domain-containing protein n=1 Tax=Clostridium sp. C105KSO13 TaxID=1776045 RepID=UPI0007407529|nr:YhgE/Pip domain-containing protein [Clostridium sp. C105KSO13]CUX44993.1 Chromosome partition protein Smc [Clostridium sp. C105KSO13]
MRNMWNIFKRDVLRIRKNVIAMIVILGITVVPSLYAWFNIAASWDPYGNTGNLKVAVASADEGYEGSLVPVSLNLGDNVLSALRENSQLDWNFTSKGKAIKGVKSGRYYAAIVIPKDFSRNMMSIFSSDIINPKITYYSNAKENAIAPKVTDKGANAVQTQVNEVFIETISNTALAAMQAVANTADENQTASIVAVLTENLENMSADLTAASGTVQAFSLMTVSTQKMLDTTSAFLKQSGQKTDSNLNALAKSKTSFTDMQSAMQGATEGINQALTNSHSYYDQLGETINEAMDPISSDAAAVSDFLNNFAGEAGSISSSFADMAGAMTNVSENVKPGQPVLAADIDAVVEKLNDAAARQNKLSESLSSAASDGEAISGDSASMEETQALLKQSVQSIDEVKAEYEQNVKQSLGNLAGTLEGTENNISGLLTQINNSAAGVNILSDSASSDLSQVQKTLDTSCDLLKTASSRLSDTVTKLKAAQASGDLKSVESILGNDKESISSLLASPVSLDTKKLYPVENYGSSMAPFYSTLAIWVGGIVLAAMLKVKVSSSAVEGLQNVKNYQVYLGRHMIFLLAGLLQAGLICLGDIYYLEIQCVHPFLFLVAGWFTSIVYVNIIYTLTVSFGDIGKAICVVLLVMQVAGSGGTFPIEVAPVFFRKVYPLLPFVHSMAAMRECVGGMYGNTYWKELGILGIFLIMSLILGLVLRSPIIKLNEAFGEKLEETHLM